MDQPTPFLEVQRFRQPWLLAILVGISGLMWWGFVTQIILGRPWGTKPAPDLVVWVLVVLFGVGFPSFFWFGAMRTQVEGRTLHIRYFGIYRRSIAVDDILEASAVTYRPFLDYGGWGIRLGLQGWCYNVAGNRGVLLRLRDGRQVMVGSQEPERLARAIRG